MSDTTKRRKHRIGLVGLGQRAPEHVGQVRALGHEVAGAFDPSPAGLERARGLEIDAKTSFEELLDADLDSLLICTPPEVRVDPVRRALERGLHIFCEKPLALSLRDADELRSLVRDHPRRTFMVGYNSRFKRELRAMRQIYARGELGELVACWVTKTEYFPQSRWDELAARLDWRASTASGGGRFMERSHQLDWLTWVGGRVQSLHGVLGTVAANVEVDDVNLVSMRFAKGAGALTLALTPTTGEQMSAGIVGRVASVQYDGQRVIKTQNGGASMAVDAGQSLSMHQHFFACIENGIEPDSNVESAYETLRACFMIQQSDAKQTSIADERYVRDHD